MVIDASALLAILLGEPEADRLRLAIRRADRRWLAAPSYVEAGMVIAARRGADARGRLDALIAVLDVEVVDMTPDAADAAHQAVLRYGKGVGSPGVLNFGDCLAYGVARALGEPLLYKGGDFARTDLAATPY